MGRGEAIRQARARVMAGFERRSVAGRSTSAISARLSESRLDGMSGTVIGAEDGQKRRAAMARPMREPIGPAVETLARKLAGAKPDGQAARAAVSAR